MELMFTLLVSRPLLTLAIVFGLGFAAGYYVGSPAVPSSVIEPLKH